MINAQNRIELRLFGSLLSATLASNMVIDALWMFSEQTVISKVASTSTYPQALSYYLFICALLVLPYFSMLATGLFQNYNRKISRLACRSILASGMLYAYLGFLARNLDYAYVSESFIIMCLLSIGTAGALAYGLNASQIIKEDEKSYNFDNLREKIAKAFYKQKPQKEATKEEKQ